ncbi:hypothetical protein AMTRI_Chr03g143890 [Amborella trichopoda]
MLCSICIIFISRKDSKLNSLSFSSSSYSSKTRGAFQLTCLIIKEEFNLISLKLVYTNYPDQLLFYTPICNNHLLCFHQKILVLNLKFLQLEKVRLPISKIL